MFGSSFMSHSVSRRAARASLLVAAALQLALPAAAETPSGLAAPGPCAEPREAISGAASSSSSVMAVVGPLGAFFNPADVAAAPRAAARPSPAAAVALRPDACDQPGAGCARQPTPGLPGVPPIVPGGPPPSGKSPIVPGHTLGSAPGSKQ